MTAVNTDVTVGQLVIDRPSRSRVFERLGIDFCCGGKKTLRQACGDKGLDPREVLKALASEESNAGQGQESVATLTLSQLCDHIMQTHHAYLREELPRLDAMVRKVAEVHGRLHPWMIELRSIFFAFRDELASHMMKEEQVLFPMIRHLEASSSRPTFHCGSISNPIRMMEHEHDHAGAALARMRVLTNGFSPPQGACNTFIAMLDGLAQLESDMHLHVHKENNLLFPRAEELYRRLA